MRVLVIDDSEVARERMSGLLQEAGHDVITLPSPIGVTRSILRDEVKVVVVDVNMPNMSGDRLIALFRSNERMSKVGVVLVSAMGQAPLERLAIKSKADAFVTKDNLADGLSEAVMRAYRARG